jgi:hypothetical protein
VGGGGVGGGGEMLIDCTSNRLYDCLGEMMAHDWHDLLTPPS